MEWKALGGRSCTLNRVDQELIWCTLGEDGYVYLGAYAERDHWKGRPIKSFMHASSWAARITEEEAYHLGFAWKTSSCVGTRIDGWLDALDYIAGVLGWHNSKP